MFSKLTRLVAIVVTNTLKQKICFLYSQVREYLRSLIQLVGFENLQQFEDLPKDGEAKYHRAKKNTNP